MRNNKCNHQIDGAMGRILREVSCFLHVRKIRRNKENTRKKCLHSHFSYAIIYKAHCEWKSHSRKLNTYADRKTGASLVV